MELIDAKLLLELVQDMYLLRQDEKDMIAKIIKYAPKVDAEAVVRCKECKYRMLNDDKDFSVEWYCDLDTNDFYAMGRNAYDENWFCADGERREDAETD